MKNFLRLTALVTLCITCIWVLAEEPTEPQSQTPELKSADAAIRPPPKPYPGQRDSYRPFPQRNNMKNRPRQTPRPQRPDIVKQRQAMADAFLKHLRQEDPAEADRLQQLRQTDQKAFVRGVKQHLNERKLELTLQRYPQILEAIHALPQAERADVMGILTSQRSAQLRPQGRKNFQIQGLPGVSDTASKEASDLRPAGDAQRDKATFKLARAYQASSDPAEQARLNTEIQAQLEEIFDTREAFQEQQVATIEANLKQLKERIEARKSQRDKIIDQRRQELTGDSDLSW